jgi:hypothetical protein
MACKKGFLLLKNGKTKDKDFFLNFMGKDFNEKWKSYLHMMRLN